MMVSCTLSQGQKEALVAEVALIVDGSITDEATVGVDKADFFVQFSSDSVSSNSSGTPQFQF